jgi:hypothetical protein
MIEEKNMEKANLFGRMVLFMRENSKAITLKVAVFTNGVMDEYMMDNGVTIKWKEQESSAGQTDENM